MVSFDAPAEIQCSTSCRLIYKASPKAISRRTSYLRVRLEFLPYPHLIATLFNGCAFGPPLPLTAASSWTWVGHPVSGLRLLTCRPVKTWSPFGSGPLVLNLASSRNSPDRSTKSTPSHMTLLAAYEHIAWPLPHHPFIDLVPLSISCMMVSSSCLASSSTASTYFASKPLVDASISRILHAHKFQAMPWCFDSL